MKCGTFAVFVISASLQLYPSTANADQLLSVDETVELGRGLPIHQSLTDYVAERRQMNPAAAPIFRGWAEEHENRAVRLSGIRALGWTGRDQDVIFLRRLISSFNGEVDLFEYQALTASIDAINLLALRGNGSAIEAISEMSDPTFWAEEGILLYPPESSPLDPRVAASLLAYRGVLQLDNPPEAPYLQQLIDETEGDEGKLMLEAELEGVRQAARNWRHAVDAAGQAERPHDDHDVGEQMPEVRDDSNPDFDQNQIFDEARDSFWQMVVRLQQENLQPGEAEALLLDNGRPAERLPEDDVHMLQDLTRRFDEDVLRLENGTVEYDAARSVFIVTFEAEGLPALVDAWLEAHDISVHRIGEEQSQSVFLERDEGRWRWLPPGW
jgi:hypothetical protein